MSTIAERVKRIIMDKGDFLPEEVTENAHFKKDLGFDSIDLVELTMEFEREFSMRISDKAAENMHTVEDVIAFITKYFEAR